MRLAILNQKLLTVALIGTAFVSSGCGEVARTGRSPAYLQIVVLEAASGATPDAFGTFLNSDVVTNVSTTIGGEEVLVPTRFNDIGRVQLRLGLKNPGTVAAPTVPSPLNSITLQRYRVTFVRADGRNTQGVDVPYAFDGGMTLTVPATGLVSGAFEVVRHAAKLEAPLLNMARFGGAQLISTLAEVTFYGRDQAGHDVTVSGTITVVFGDFGDPS